MPARVRSRLSRRTRVLDDHATARASTPPYPTVSMRSGIERAARAVQFLMWDMRGCFGSVGVVLRAHHTPRRGFAHVPSRWVFPLHNHRSQTPFLEAHQHFGNRHESQRGRFVQLSYTLTTFAALDVSPCVDSLQ
jgi:hypothetical protein